VARRDDDTAPGRGLGDPLFDSLLGDGLRDLLEEVEALEVEVASWVSAGVRAEAAARVLLGLERVVALLTRLGAAPAGRASVGRSGGR
jgi:hypothetical protein